MTDYYADSSVLVKRHVRETGRVSFFILPPSSFAYAF